MAGRKSPTKTSKSTHATIPGGVDPISVMLPTESTFFDPPEQLPLPNSSPSTMSHQLIDHPVEEPRTNQEMQEQFYHREKYGPVPYLQPLARLSMEYYENPAYIEDVEIDFPGCFPVNSFKNGSPEQHRVRDCIQVGMESLRREYSEQSHNHPTRRELHSHFASEQDILLQVLTMVERYNSPGRAPVGYRVKRGHYITLNTALNERRNRVKDSILARGGELPPIPMWGTGQPIEAFYTPNDFEIYSALLRYDVEEFMAAVIYEEKRSNEEPVPGSPLTFDKRPMSPAQVDPVSSISSAQQRLNRGAERRQTLRFEQDEEDISYESTSRPRKTTPSSPLSSMIPANRISATLRPNIAASTAGKGFKALFSERDRPPHEEPKPDLQREQKHRQNSSFHKHIKRAGGDPDPDSSDSDDGFGPNRGPRRSERPQKVPPRQTNGSSSASTEVTFDQKLKVDIIPTWDGNPDTLGRWISKINRLSERSSLVYSQLGILVPTRLRDSAETWYYSMNPVTRTRIEQNWGSLRDAIGAYFMNRSFLDKQKARANRMAYRDSAAPKESPSDYFIRKLELLELVYNYSDTELINEIMAGAPSQWTAILTPHLYHSIEDFQRIVKFHEEALLQLSTPQAPNRAPYTRFTHHNSRNPFVNSTESPTSARTNLVGWSKQTINPQFPKDDANISPRGTPVSKGGRPCRHCGSGNHWDPECKYARKGEKRARVNLAATSTEDREAQGQYDDLYYSLVSDSEEEDFQSPLSLNNPN